MTLLLCALLPKALRDATVLLQYRSAQLQESILRMNSSRQMSTAVEYVRVNAACPMSDKVAEVHCLDVAKRLGLAIANAAETPHIIESPIQSMPSGCFMDERGKLFYNKKAGNTHTSCTGGQTCICRDESGTTKEYLIDSGSCQAGDTIAESECASRANALGLNYVRTNFRLNTPNWPAGCFFRESKNILYYNSLLTAAVACGVNKKCLCYGKPRNIDGPGDTENTPPPPPAAYTKGCGTCPTSITSMGDCKKAADAKGIQYSHEEAFNDVNSLPYGCFTINQKLAYNSNTAGQGTCDSSTRTCICAGTLPSAYSQTTSICPPSERLPKCQCTEMAISLNMTYSDVEEMTDNNYPAGCFIILKTLWYNHAGSSVATCSDEKTCICAR